MKNAMVNPLVSVIVPIHPENDYSHLWNGLFFQTFSNIEVFFAFPHKNIENLDFFNAYARDDDRFNLIFKLKNETIQAFTKRVMAATTGKYIFCVNTDDALEKDAIEKMYYQAEATNADVVCCSFDEIDKISEKAISTNQLEVPLPIGTKTFSIQDRPDFLSKITFPCISNKIIKKDFLLKYSLHKHFSVFDSCHFMESYAYILGGKFSCICKVLTHHYLSLSDIESNWRKIIDSLFDFESSLPKAENKYFIEQAFINMMVNVCMFFSHMREPEAAHFKIRMLSEIIPHFHLDTLDEKYFYNKEAYAFIQDFQKDKQLLLTLKDNLCGSKKTIIPVFFITQKQEDVYNVAVTIQSILDQQEQNCFYDVYVLNKIKNVDIFRTLKTLSGENIRVNVVNISAKNQNNLESVIQKQPEASLCLISDIISGYEKVIFLRNSLIIKSPLSNLFNMDMGINAIAGVKAYGDKSYIEEKLDLLYENYISTDILLINIDPFLAEYQALINNLINFQNTYLNLFQDSINIAYRNQILVLDDAWDTRYSLYQSNRYFNLLSMESIKIFNFDTENPQLDPEISLSEMWWLLARKLPFYEEILMFNIRKNFAITPTSVIQPPVSKQTSKPVGQNSISSQTVPIKKKTGLSQEEIASLKFAYITESFKYIFSIGKKRKDCKKKLDEIANVLSTCLR